MSFLGIDIGNSRLKWTLYEAPRPGARVIAQGAVFLESIDTLSETDWRDLPAPTAMIGCNVAGEAVRHRLEAQLEQMAQWDFVPRWIHP
ncbi:MAG: type III pantothenate kinase, partial [Betaproteobacteria bacterium]|nr:type III pantothenate kinase [Betaproteobacteria bacterium]